MSPGRQRFAPLLAIAGVMCVMCAFPLVPEQVTANEVTGEVPSGGSPAIPDAVEFGFVFLDGALLERPYTVGWNESEVTVNGRPLGNPQYLFEDLEDFDLTDMEEGRSGRFQNRRRNRNRNRNRFRIRRAAAYLHELLSDDAVVIANTGEPLAVLSTSNKDCFFRTVLDPDPQAEHFQKFLEWSQSDSQSRMWSEWMVSWTPPDALKAFAKEYLDEADSKLATEMRRIGSIRLLDKLSYPLTLAGMILCVLAFGHLLRSAAVPESESDGTAPSSRVVQQSLLCIGFIALMSVYDLSWTLLASEAGQMRELNPIGRAFIQNPQMLIAFKIVATGLACFLLFRLRQHKSSRLAAWWLCLLCSFLTVRWITFSSLFVS